MKDSFRFSNMPLYESLNAGAGFYFSPIQKGFPEPVKYAYHFISKAIFGLLPDQWCGILCSTEFNERLRS